MLPSLSRLVGDCVPAVVLLVRLSPRRAVRAATGA